MDNKYFFNIITDLILFYLYNFLIMHNKVIDLL